MNAQITRVVVFLLVGCSVIAAQQAPATDSNSESQLAGIVQQLQKQIANLQTSVDELRSEASRYRAETLELQRRLELIAKPEVPAQPDATQAAGSSDQALEQQGAKPAGVRLSKLEEAYELLTGKVDDQYQTKVESGSKYRVRLSGLVMLNMFSNRGVPYSIDVPGIAQPTRPQYSSGSFAGTLRQSQIGLEVFGPEWAGAKVSGDLRFDFAGGFPDTENGVTLGLMRLRTGNIHINWAHTSLTAGQDAPMFSPLSPTSVISLAQPEFAYAGNLWTWIPQVQVQHWFSLPNAQRLTVTAGVMDSLTGEPPRAQFIRLPGAGEASKQPGYSARIGWSKSTNEDRPISIAAGGYFGRQDWGFNRGVDSWAATADWQIPLLRRFSLKGELYRGRALGGFGGSAGNSILSSDVLQNRLAIVRGLDSAGGWAQVSYQATPVVQFNAGYGLDNPFSSELRRFSALNNLLDPELGRNGSAMANVIYRPRSDLLFSVEYRHLASTRLTHETASAENIGLGIGLLF